MKIPGEFFEDSENYWQKKAGAFARLYRTRNPLQIPNRIFLKRRMNTVRRYVTGDGNGTAVDVGCGSGEFARELAGRYARVKAFDYSQIMLDIAKEGTERANVEFIKTDSASLPLPDGSVDILFALGLLDYVSDVAATLREFARVLKPGAQAVVTAPKSPSLFAPLRWSKDIRSFLFKIPPIVHAFKRDEIENLFADCGFRTVEMTSLWTTMWICCVRKI